MTVSSDESAFNLKFLHPHAAGPLLRVGREADGGYVVPASAVGNTKLLLGIGIHDDWSFEEDFTAKNPGVRVVAVDGTVSLRMLFHKTVSRVFEGVGALFTLQFGKAAGRFGYWSKIPRFRAFFRRHTFLRLMLRPQPEPGGITLGELIKEFRPQGSGEPDVFLKMDIEGGEYEVLRNAGPLLKAVHCLTVEFHALSHRWQDLRDIAEALESDFLIAHVHGNNYAPLIAGTAVPSVLEITWLHRSLAPANPQPAPGPWPLPGLDRPCSPKAADYPLDFW